MKTTLLVLCLFLTPIIASAQWVFNDDFSNREASAHNWTLIDSSFVLENGEWTGEFREWGPAKIGLDGALTMETGGPVPLADETLFPLGDINVFDFANSGLLQATLNQTQLAPARDIVARSKVRVDTRTNAAIGLRGNSNTFSFYAVTAAGAYGKFAISRIQNGIQDYVELFDEPTFSLGEEWWMEGSTIGDQITLKVWQDGTSEPAIPQFRWRDNAIESGGVGLGAVVWNNNVPEPTVLNATYDDVSIRFLDAPTLPTEFVDGDFADWGVSPLGLPGNADWSVVDTSILDSSIMLRPQEEWESWGPAIVDVEDGKLNLRSSNPISVANSELYEHGNVEVFPPIENSGLTYALWNPSVSNLVADATVKTKLNVATDTESTIFLRADGTSGYAFSASAVTNDFAISLFENGERTRFEFAEVSDFDPNEDWWIVSQTEGSQISLWAWPDGAEQPVEPQVQWTDDTIPGGLVALGGAVWTNMIDEPTIMNTTFDDISISGVSPFLFCAPLNSLVGDLDGNGQVDFTDFLRLSANFGQSVATYESGDIDCDGSVRFTDFLQLSANFGASLESTNAAAAVPEPPGTYAAFALVVLLVRRRTVTGRNS